jgi:hypothetical protein
MKHVTLIASLLLLMLLAGCSESSSTSKKSDGSNGGSGNGLTDSCTGNAYWQMVGCPGFCQNNSGHASCSGGSTSGSTTGSTTGTTGGGSYGTIPSDNNWQALYPSGEPTGSCSTPTGTGFPLRKGTVTMSGGVYYSPDLSWTSVGESDYTSIRYSHNVSSFLTDVAEAQSFIDTDSVLKVRFKPRPQPKAPSTAQSPRSWCFGRVVGQTADAWGYTQLRFTVALKGTDGILRGTQQITTSVNSCSAAVDFSNIVTPGAVIVIRDVYSNQGCTYQSGCTSWVKVRNASCWQMDIEVQVDGTKSI